MIGFVSSLDKVDVDWPFLLLFSALSVLGILMGVQLAKRIEGRKLRPLFGWFVLAMAVFIILNELFLKQIV
jgi:uncharacterized membrane protein YfcA